MKHQLLKYYLFFIFTTSFVACTDLEENLVGDITRVESVDTDSVPDPMVPFAYGELRNTGTANHGSYYSLQELTSDEMVICTKGSEWYSGGETVQLHQHTYTPQHFYVNATFSQTYSAIETFNNILRNDGLSREDRAQARSLRAYFYWRMLDLFGRVKIITETNPDPPQATRAELFNFVESELLAALDVAELSDSMDLTNSPLADGGSCLHHESLRRPWVVGQTLPER
jgi:hypothetical protein